MLPESLNISFFSDADSFIVLFNKVPYGGGDEQGFDYSYRWSRSSRSSGKGNYYYGKGNYKANKGKSMSKSSKKTSKRDSFMYRHAPIQIYDFYPVRPIHFVFPVNPPLSVPFSAPVSAPTATYHPKSPTATPSAPSSPIDQPTYKPVAQPTASPDQ